MGCLCSAQCSAFTLWEYVSWYSSISPCFSWWLVCSGFSQGRQLTCPVFTRDKYCVCVCVCMCVSIYMCEYMCMCIDEFLFLTWRADIGWASAALLFLVLESDIFMHMKWDMTRDEWENTFCVKFDGFAWGLHGPSTLQGSALQIGQILHRIKNICLLCWKSEYVTIKI